MSEERKAEPLFKNVDEAANFVALLPHQQKQWLAERDYPTDDASVEDARTWATRMIEAADS